MYEGTLVPALGVMIPIVAIIMGVGIGMLRLWLDYRNKRDIFRLHHAERLAAIEKGIELPPLPPEFFLGYPSPRAVGEPARTLRNGLVLLFLGAAIFLALRAETGLVNAWWGLIPAAIGVAYLLYYALVGHRREAGGGRADGTAVHGASDRPGRPPSGP